MKNKLSLAILLHLLAAVVLLHGAEDSTQLKETVLSALDLFMTGNYSCDFLLQWVLYAYIRIISIHCAMSEPLRSSQYLNIVI